MLKRKRQKDRQHNAQKKKTEEQTTQCSKEKDRRTYNTMLKRKRTKRPTTITKTLHRIHMIEQRKHEDKYFKMENIIGKA
jgi:hypothetical protein